MYVGLYMIKFRPDKVFIIDLNNVVLKEICTDDEMPLDLMFIDIVPN